MATGKSTAILRHIDKLVTEQKTRRHSDRELLQRFARQGDKAAFAAILQRHGTMVLQVCRRLLADPHDADDAFQATFLVLLRRASGLRWRDSVGGWLHEVAYRVSLEMRKRRRKRHAHEAQAAAPLAEDPADNGVRRRRPVRSFIGGDRPPAYCRSFVITRPVVTPHVRPN